MQNKKPEILYLSFNQSFELLNCGLSIGFSILDCNPVKTRFLHEFNFKITNVEIINQSNHVFIVGDNQNDSEQKKKFFLWDNYQLQKLFEVDHPDPIKKIKYLNKYFFVMTSKKAFLYSIEGAKLIKSVETIENKKGIISAARKPDSIIFAIPGNSKGYVRVFNFSKESPFETHFQAHNHEIESIELNYEGTLVATASSEGTLIRVFETSKGEQISQFRRGRKQSQIYCLAFSLDNKYLISVSSSKTLHVFKLPTKEDKQKKGFSLKSFYDMNSERSFVSIKLDTSKYSICAFDPKDQDIINIACINGIFTKFRIDFKEKTLKKITSINFLLDQKFEFNEKLFETKSKSKSKSISISISNSNSNSKSNSNSNSKSKSNSNSNSDAKYSDTDSDFDFI
ncbi:wd-repeat protein interacting with phosphoinosides wipi -related [Anaeramoeba ignava]|uniref:Wd-repeat protein interacting with phosphoinosides wipi -related n=1 Tax=Anaeramoeba ignava TaxID=1746090 RepID=A0A9Q0RHZ8_ANAIG|nr:wd-repeat protein interacting with phosphoinosides wipi -related [Anaeramoeba ignava]